MWKLITKWKNDTHNSPASCSAPGGAQGNLQLVSTTQRPFQHPFLGHRFPSLESWTTEQPSGTPGPFWGGTFGLFKATGYSTASRSAPLIRELLAFLNLYFLKSWRRWELITPTPCRRFLRKAHTYIWNISRLFSHILCTIPDTFKCWMKSEWSGSEKIPR